MKRLLVLWLVGVGSAIAWGQNGCQVLSNGWLGCTALPTSCQSGVSASVYLYSSQVVYDCLGDVYVQRAGGAGTIAHTTNTLAGDGSGNAIGVTGTGTNCVLVNGTSTTCGGGGGGTGNAAVEHSVTFSATPTFACGSASAGTVDSFAMSTALSANITSSTLSGCTSGQVLNFVFTQAASGGPYTVAMPTGFSQACQVSPTASSNTKMGFWWDGTTGQLVSCSVDTGPAVEVTQSAPSISAESGTVLVWADSTSETINTKDSSGVVRVTGWVVTSGALALATSAISSGACQTVTPGSVNSVAGTGVVATDIIAFTPNGSIKAVTGFVPGTGGGLTVNAYPTSGFVNFDVCNWSSGSITPGAVTLNYQVIR